MSVDWNLVSIILFYFLVGLFFFLKRGKIEVQSKILFLYKTKRGLRLLRKIAKSARRLWQLIGYAGIPVGFAGMVFILAFLIWSLIKIIKSKGAFASVSLVLPGVKIPGSMFIPFWYGIISLLVVILVHESAHGILSETWRQKIKSAGVGLALFLPMAFVELDEKKQERAPLKAQLSIFAAGPFANLLTAGLIFALGTFFIWPTVATITEPAGLQVQRVIEGYPAFQAGLQAGDVIYGTAEQNMDAKQFVSYLSKLKPGDVITLNTSRGLVSLQTVENPKKPGLAYVGIEFVQKIKLKSGEPDLLWAVVYFGRLLYWLIVLNFGIGLFNLLPIGPLDGGRMLYAILKAKFNKRKATKLVSYFSMFSLTILLLNFVLPYLLRGVNFI